MAKPQIAFSTDPCASAWGSSDLCSRGSCGRREVPDNNSVVIQIIRGNPWPLYSNAFLAEIFVIKSDDWVIEFDDIVIRNDDKDLAAL